MGLTMKYIGVQPSRPAGKAGIRCHAANFKIRSSGSQIFPGLVPVGMNSRQDQVL